MFFSLGPYSPLRIFSRIPFGRTGRMIRVEHISLIQLEDRL